MDIISDYETQDIAINLIMSGYADENTAIRKAKAIKAGMYVINNLNDAATTESEKCKVYRKETVYSYGDKFLKDFKVVNVDTSDTRATELLRLKEVEWKMMTDITGLNEFEIIEVA